MGAMSRPSRLSRLLPKFLRGDKGKSSTSSTDWGIDGEPIKDGNACQVYLLDDTDIKFPYKGSVKGNILLEKVFNYLNLAEKDYFGLRYIDSNEQTHWLDCRKNLSSQLKGCSVPYQLYFGVKFYPVDPCKLLDEITRYQFFLQLKKDIYQGRLPVTFKEATEIFSYAVQSELGDFDKSLQPGYVSEFRFIPNQTHEFEEIVASNHRRLMGMAAGTAEYKFLDKVKWMDMYGVDLHPVLGENNTEYFLGLTPMGIVVYKNKNKVGNYFWTRITKVTFKNKIFIIKVKDKNNDEHTYAFEVGSKLGCKHLWKCCVEHHSFFRLKQASNSFARSEYSYRSTSAIGHKSRSGRHERLTTQSESGRSEPTVNRVSSRKHPKRSSSDSRIRAPEGGVPVMVSGTSITRMSAPEDKGSRHKSLPDLQRNQSPKSTRSAPWEKGDDVGLYTSGRDSPTSMHSEAYRHMPQYGPGSDTESGYRRKYFPNKKTGSDNESDVSFTRRRRRDDSGSESDFPMSGRDRRSRRPKSSGEDWFASQWNDTANSMNGRLADESAFSVHSAPSAEAARRRRRRKSKSPHGQGRRPPEELKQHIEYELVETEGMTEEELRNIPYMKVETKGDAFKVRYSPKTRQRYRSPKRKSMGELDTDGGIQFTDEPPPPYTEEALSRTPENRRRGYLSDTNSCYRNKSSSDILPRERSRDQNSVVSQPITASNKFLTKEFHILPQDIFVINPHGFQQSRDIDNMSHDTLQSHDPDSTSHDTLRSRDIDSSLSSEQMSSRALEESRRPETMNFDHRIDRLRGPPPPTMAENRRYDRGSQDMMRRGQPPVRDTDNRRNDLSTNTHSREQSPMADPRRMQYAMNGQIREQSPLGGGRQSTPPSMPEQRRGRSPQKEGIPQVQYQLRSTVDKNTEACNRPTSTACGVEDGIDMGDNSVFEPEEWAEGFKNEEIVEEGDRNDHQNPAYGSSAPPLPQRNYMPSQYGSPPNHYSKDRPSVGQTNQYSSHDDRYQGYSGPSRVQDLSSSYSAVRSPLKPSGYSRNDPSYQTGYSGTTELNNNNKYHSQGTDTNRQQIPTPERLSHYGSNMANRPLPQPPSSASPLNRSFGTSDTIKQMYSSPQPKMYATQDSIRQMYHSRPSHSPATMSSPGSKLANMSPTKNTGVSTYHNKVPYPSQSQPQYQSYGKGRGTNTLNGYPQNVNY